MLNLIEQLREAMATFLEEARKAICADEGLRLSERQKSRILARGADNAPEPDDHLYPTEKGVYRVIENRNMFQHDTLFAYFDGKKFCYRVACLDPSNDDDCCYVIREAYHSREKQTDAPAWVDDWFGPYEVLSESAPSVSIDHPAPQVPVKAQEGYHVPIKPTPGQGYTFEEPVVPGAEFKWVKGVPYDEADFSDEGYVCSKCAFGGNGSRCVGKPDGLICVKNCEVGYFVKI